MSNPRSEYSFYVDRQHLLKIVATHTGEEIQFTLPAELSAIAEFIEIKMGDTPIQFENGVCVVKINPASDTAIKCLIKVKEDTIADFNITGGVIEKLPEPSLLTTFEIKSLAHYGGATKTPSKAQDTQYSPTTDLHTHYAGAITKEDIIAIATDNGASPYFYPLNLLKQMKLDVTPYEASAVTSAAFPDQTNVDNWFPEQTVKYMDIRTLSDSDRKKFIDHLSIPHTKQITFEDVEEYYNYRGVFTSDVKLFEKYLWALANDYKKSGVDNVSLSLSRIIEPDWLQVADKCLPEIEAKLGIKMRFLVSIFRHYTPEKMQDMIRSIQVSGLHPCIEGVDFLASETNSTFDFYPALHEIAAWAQANDPSFVLRIHAGETTYHPENIKAALQIAEQYNLPIRIGHGIYGSGEETIALAKQLYERGLPVFIEMNPDSNYSLNNIDNTSDYPLVSYAQAGLPCVLGTDGHGLYHTDSRQLTHVLQYLDADPEMLTKALALGDELYTELNAEAYAQKDKIYRQMLDKKVAEILQANAGMSREDAVKKAFRELFKPPDASKLTPPDVWKRYREEDKAKREALVSHIKASKIQCDKATVAADLQGKTPIMLTGAIIGDGIENIIQTQALIYTLLTSLDPSKTYFATSGTDYGIQKIVHECIDEYNKQQTNPTKRFALVGHVAQKAQPEAVSQALTHATLDYNKWYDIHKKINDDIENENLQLIVIGGTMLTRDIIQSAYNVISDGDPAKQNTSLHLIQDSTGAAQDKSKHLPAQYSTDFRHVASKMLQQKPELFHKSVTQDTLESGHQASVALLQQDVKAVKKQGPYTSISNHDKAKWLISECKRLNISVQEHVALDFFNKGCPATHKIAETIKPHYNLLSKALIEVFELSKKPDGSQKSLAETERMFAAAPPDHKPDREITPTEPSPEATSTATKIKGAQ